MELMKDSDDWEADGTFAAVASTPFNQAYVIFVKKSKISVPCAFFLLPNKRKSTYIQMFEILSRRIPNGPRFFHADFEVAVISALQEIYAGTEVSFCNFHWSQALERNIKSHGLGSYINKRLDLQLFVRSLWSLIFLPADDFAMAFEKIIEDTPLMDEDDEAPEEERESYNQGVKGFLIY